MPNYRVAKLAEWDLKAIARHTLRILGYAQTRHYLRGLFDCFQTVADDPTLGCQCNAILPGLRRIEYNRHVFFYALSAGRVIIARVLPLQMIPQRSLL